MEFPRSGPRDPSLRRKPALNTVPVTRGQMPCPQCSAPCGILKPTVQVGGPPPPRRPPCCHVAAQPQSLGSSPAEPPKNEITPESVFLTLFSVVFDRHSTRQSFAVQVFQWTSAEKYRQFPVCELCLCPLLFWAEECRHQHPYARGTIQFFSPSSPAQGLGVLCSQLPGHMLGTIAS